MAVVIEPLVEIDAPADVVDPLGSLVQEDLEHREVGEAEPRGLDAPHRVPGKGAVRLHQDEPEMDAGVLGSCVRHAITRVCTERRRRLKRDGSAYLGGTTPGALAP